MFISVKYETTMFLGNMQHNITQSIVDQFSYVNIRN